MRREFELTMGRTGREIPTTVLELAFLTADLGLYDRKIAGRVEVWRKVIPTPLTSETLPVSEEFAKREDESRWSDIEEESAQMILRYMIDDLGSPPMIETSLALLAEKIGLEVTDLRFGLNGLAADGFEIVEATSLKRIDPETVDEQMIVCLLVDWLLFSENRIGIVFEHRNDHGEF